MMRNATVAETFLTRLGQYVSRGIALLLKPGSASQYKIVEHTVFLPNLPTGFQGFRVAQLSDIHFYEYSDAAFLQSVMDAVNQLAPDMIVVTGDTIHYGAQYLEFGCSYLKQLRAPCGKWACMGNHDYYDDFHGKGVLKMLHSAGFQTLVNNAARIEKEGHVIWLSGLDDFKKGQPDPDKAFQDIDTTTVHLCLSHNPTLASLVSQHPHRPDFVMSGHTHGGHVSHPLVQWGQKHFGGMHYRYGWFTLAHHLKLYVTSGIGSAAITVHTAKLNFSLQPFRIGTMPEIPVFTLVRAEPAGQL